MSAIHPKADMVQHRCDVRFVPEDIGCFAAVATMDVAAGAVAIGAWTGYFTDIAAGMTVCYMTFKFCVFCWKLYR
jgi:hypothetical protein